jgi:uncharacterized protein (DUF433 family)
MATRHKDIYRNRDPRAIPAYPVFEAARYLGIPEPKLRAWVGGKPGFKPVIKVPEDSDGQLSFFNLVEAFVIYGLRTRHGLTLQRVRQNVDALRSLAAHSEHPLADLDLATFAREVYIDRPNELLNVSHPGQLGLQEVLRPVLERVEKDILGVARLYPFTRPEPSSSPKLIVIDPLIAFGRPVIRGTGIPTAVIHERWKAGDSAKSLAEDYDRPEEEIEEALRYEAA